jgi:hypothetical protein
MWDSLGVVGAESVKCDFLDGALPGVQMTQSRARYTRIVTRNTVVSRHTMGAKGMGS